MGQGYLHALLLKTEGDFCTDRKRTICSASQKTDLINSCSYHGLYKCQICSTLHRNNQRGKHTGDYQRFRWQTASRSGSQMTSEAEIHFLAPLYHPSERHLQNCNAQYQIHCIRQTAQIRVLFFPISLAAFLFTKNRISFSGVYQNTA